MQQNSIHLSLGSNQGDRLAILRKARNDLSLQAGDILKCSSIFETPPWGFQSNTSFYNIALEISSSLSPNEVFNTILTIEKTHGRKRDANQKGYQSRPIDIDILFFNNEIIQTPNLTIPHPLLHKRNFVLAPLNEICPQLIHPVLKKSIQDLFSANYSPKDILSKINFT